MDESTKEEARAFDLRVRERVKAGHLPDLRRVKTCHYFYDNVWREPLYVKLSIWPRFSFIMKHIKALGLRNPRVLEIGCGIGFISLELARNGCYVTGIDISKESINVAKEIANENPFKENFGQLEYHVVEIFDFLRNAKDKFDAVAFYGVLHHFIYSELEELSSKIKDVLDENGIIVGYEPAYDRFNESSATLLLILRILLKRAGNHFSEATIPDNEYELIKDIRETLMSSRQMTKGMTNVQSAKDFSSGYTDMITAFNLNFKTLALEDGHGLFEFLVGGLRGKKEETEKLARFIDIIDKKLVTYGFLQPLSFLFAGKRINLK